MSYRTHMTNYQKILSQDIKTWRLKLAICI